MTIAISKSDQVVIEQTTNNIYAIKHRGLSREAYMKEVMSLEEVIKVYPSGGLSSSGETFTIHISLPDQGEKTGREKRIKITKRFS
ncbi:MAG: hypothetical protein WC523_05920 [Patescibacteria group bacterium]|jgi:hypothetical protein